MKLCFPDFTKTGKTKSGCSNKMLLLKISSRYLALAINGFLYGQFLIRMSLNLYL